ncbi:hypothetical protein V5799_005198 [Amblyomma americanum]|uniref:G-protein coupled receptors family 3 profile domain-containing protein n=1 Tax=Amblyomma americanum TaxID=6943 RepID=A0AAQ4DZY2_AMBAM
MTNFSGDILLGALFPVHERNATYECGRIQDEGVEQLEALLFTLHKINNDSTLLPGVSLGVLALDSCDSTEYALEQSLDFVKVSYQSTSPTLSNKHRFGYFFRTVPSDVNQAHAILELLRAFHWTYVSVVYSDTDYGNKGYDKLQELAARYSICLSNPQSIAADHYTDVDYDAVIRSLTHRSSARVVVVFADKGAARSLMRAAWRRRARFVWIGSDAWSGLESVAQGHEEVVEGAITVSPMVQPLRGFESHFRELTPDNNVLNPWFPEYWEEKFQCRLPDFQYLADEFHCRDCPLGTVPDPESKARCLPLPEEFLSYGDPWAVAALAVAALGAAAVVFVALVFRSYADTPVVKASGRELSSLLLFGLLMSYALTPVIVAKPSAWSCALTRFFLGLCYSVCYAALLCKTIRTARIFGGGRRRLRYTSPRSQLLLAGLLVSVQVALATGWLLLEPPSVAHVYPNRARNVLVCQGSDRPAYLLGLVYPSLLIGICTVYAFKTRKCPEGFNEARHLAFANYTTCVIWLAFLPLFLLSGSPTIRTLALSFLLSLSGAVQTACLFAPKVYVRPTPLLRHISGIRI